MSRTASRLLRRIEHAAGGAGLTALFVVVWVLNVAISIVVALVMLFEEWGWEPLHRAIAALAKFRPVAALAAMIARLPPYGALIVFAVPVVLLIPVKLSALYLLTGRS